MVSTRISLGVAFLTKRINAHVSAKAIVHAEMVTATGKYLLSKITYQYNSELMLNIRTKEIECDNIVDVLQRLSKAVTHRVELGYVFDSSAVESMEEEDEVWGSFTLGAGSSFDPELDAEAEVATIGNVLRITPRQTKKRSKVVEGSQRSKSFVNPKLRLKRRFESRRMASSGVRVR